jgi:hypothetical protein
MVDKQFNLYQHQIQLMKKKVEEKEMVAIIKSLYYLNVERPYLEHLS